MKAILAFFMPGFLEVLIFVAPVIVVVILIVVLLNWKR